MNSRKTYRVKYCIGKGKRVRIRTIQHWSSNVDEVVEYAYEHVLRQSANILAVEELTVPQDRLPDGF